VCDAVCTCAACSSSQYDTGAIFNSNRKSKITHFAIIQSFIDDFPYYFLFSSD
jgi:hypothetical protein